MPKINTFKTVASYNSRILASYQQKMKQQQHLLAIIKAVLPKPLTDHVLYCTIAINKLFIYTYSATWSSQLRFYQQTMLNAVINANLTTIKTIQIKLIVPEDHSPKNKHLLNIPSDDNIKLLHQCGKSVNNGNLKKALLNLSETLNKLSSHQEKNTA